jgi:hypothetical protein
VYALCVCVDSSGCAVGLVVGDFFYQLFNDTYYLLLSSYDFIISCLPSFVTRFIYFIIISNIIISKTYYSKIKKNGERSGNKLLRIKPRRNPADPRWRKSRCRENKLDFSIVIASICLRHCRGGLLEVNVTNSTPPQGAYVSLRKLGISEKVSSRLSLSALYFPRYRWRCDFSIARRRSHVM